MIADKYNKLAEIDNMNGQIKGLITKVEELELEREEKFKLFVSEKEVEELYQLISFSAIRNQLKVKKLIRGEEEAVRGGAAASGADISTVPVDYYKIFVEYDIEGKFPNYLKLKEEIVEIEKDVDRLYSDCLAAGIDVDNVDDADDFLTSDEYRSEEGSNESGDILEGISSSHSETSSSQSTFTLPFPRTEDELASINRLRPG